MDLTARLSEAAGGERKNAIKALTNAAPRIALMKEDIKAGRLIDLNVSDALMEGSMAYRRLLQDDKPDVNTYLKQNTMFSMESGAARAMLEGLDKYKRSAASMTNMFHSILDLVEEYGNPNQVAMPGLERSTPSMESVIQEGIDNYQRQREGFAASERFSVRELPDGKRYVAVTRDQHLIDNVSPEEYRKVARKYILKNYGKKVIGRTQRAYVRKESANEFAYPANRRIPDDVLNAKLRSSTEIYNMMEAGTFIKNEPDKGYHPDATGGWDYYDFTYQVGNRF